MNVMEIASVFEVGAVVLAQARLNLPSITSSWVFWGCVVVFLGYMTYISLRVRKPLAPPADREL